MAKLYLSSGKHYVAKKQEPKKLYLSSNNQDINGATYLGGKVAAGAASIGIGAWNLIAGSFDQLTGNTYAAEKRYAENSARAFSDKLDSMYDANGAMQFAGAVAEGVGQFIPTALISLIPVAGVPLAQGVQFAGYTGMNVEDAYKKTGNLGGREYLYGAAMGGFETALEFVGGKVGGWLGGTKAGGKLLGVSDNLAKATMHATSGKIGAKAATIGARTVMGGASEFTEEFIEAYAEVGLQRALQIDPNASVTLGEALYAGAVGFASGSMMSGATSVLNTKGAQMTGARIIKSGEVDMTIAAATEISTAFKASGRIESEVHKALKDNLALWEREADKTSGNAQMILGNVEVAMNVLSAMAKQQGTVRTVTANPEKFLPYAKTLFGNEVTIDDLKSADSRVVRFIAASNWATGEADALAIRAKRTRFSATVEAEMAGKGSIPSIVEHREVNGDAVYKSPDGDYVFIAEGKNGLYTVMKGKDLSNLNAYEKDGSTALEKEEVNSALQRILLGYTKDEVAAPEEQSRASVAEKPAAEPQKATEEREETDSGKTDGEEEKSAAEPQKQGEEKKPNVISDKGRRERARLIDEYGAEVQDKARKILGKSADKLSADRRIAVYEAILSGEKVDKDVLSAACYFITKRPGLYVRFDGAAASVDEKTVKGGFHKKAFGGKMRMVLAANGPKGLRKVLVHEIFHDIASTKAGEALIDAALKFTTLSEAYSTARLYGDFYAKVFGDKGVESFVKFFEDGKYDKEKLESVLDAIAAYEKKYKGILPSNPITEELVADTIAERIGNERFLKMAKDTSAAGLILRDVRRMLSYLKTKKEARPLYMQAVKLENLFLDAVEHGSSIFNTNVFAVGNAGMARYNLKAVATHLAKLEQAHSKDAAVGLEELKARYDEIVKLWRKLGGELDSEFLNNWNEKVGKDRAFTVFKAQAGYKYNAELSSMCKKGVPLFEAIDTIVRREVAKQLDSKVISKAEKEILYDILKSRGFEIPCAICYVEQARQREGVIIDAFLNGTKGGDGDEKFKLGWNSVIADVQKEMQRRGVAYKFPSLDRSVATDTYTPAGHEMSEAEQNAFYAALRKLANEEITRYNREEGKNRPLLAGTTPEAVKAAFKGTLPSNLKIFKTLFTEQLSRFTIDDDLLYSSETTQNLAAYHTGLYGLFNSQGGVSGYKTKQKPVVYWGDILGKKWRPKTVRDHGGIRNQSNSDFQIYTLLDQVQMYVDLTAKGYYLQAYTKVLAELKLFGLSGAKINASLIPRVHLFLKEDGNIDEARTRENAGLDENGNPIYDDFEGIPHEEAFMLIEDAAYSKSVGGVCIGYSDKHISALLDDDRIQLIIGFHDKTNDPKKRYRGAVFAKNYNGINEAVDDEGKTVHIGFNTFVREAEGMFKQDKQTETYSGKVTHNGKTYEANDIPRLAADLYLESCAQKGYAPAYSGRDGGVDFSTHRNYYKLLADFSLYDSEGNYAPHKRVAFSMPENVPFLDENGTRGEISAEAYIKRELEKELAVRDAISAALADTSEGGIIPEFVRRANALQDADDVDEPARSSLSDRDYLDAVNRGDTETAQRMVDEAAKKAMPDSVLREGKAISKGEDAEGTLIKMFHGSGAKNFYKFKAQDGALGKGVYVTSNWDEAVGYAIDKLGIQMSDDGNSYVWNGEEYDGIGGIGEALEAEGYVRAFYANVTDENDVSSSSVYWEDVIALVRDPSQLKSADPVTYDDNGNVIPLSERFSEESDDIRYSLAAAEAMVARSNRRKVSKGVHEKEKAELGRGLFYLLKDMRESLKSFVESGYYVAEGIKLHVRAKDLTEVARYLWEQSNTKNPDQMDGAADVVADYLLARMMVEYTDVSEGKKEALAARRILKPYYHNLALSEARKAEIRAALPRASAERFIKVFGAKEGGVDLDGDIADINAQLDGAGLVQYRIHAENDMDAMVAFANLYDSVRALEGERAMAAAGEIFNTAEDVESFRAEIKKSVLEAMKENGKPGMLRVLTEKKNAAYDRLYERWRETREKYEGAVKIQYGAAHAVFLAKELGEIVTKRKYVNAAELMTPEMEAVGRMLSSIATPRKIKDKQVREVMKTLAAWYTPANLDGDGASENGDAIETSCYHPDIKAKMEKIAAGDSNAQLTYEELRDLAQVLNAVRVVIKNYDIVVIEGNRVRATEAATSETSMLVKYLNAGAGEGGKGFISKMFHNAGEAVGKKLKNNFLYRIMTPRQVVQSLEWYDKDGVLTKAFDSIQAGLAAAGSDYADMMRPIVEFFDSHKKYEKRLTKSYISYEGEDMSVAQVISLYLTTKREQAELGLAQEGFSYMGKDGKVRRARARDAADIRSEISAALTAEDKEYIKLIEGVFARAKEFKVRTDMAVFGYTNVEDGYYFPIQRDTMGIATRLSDLRQTMRDLAVVGNKSFNKNTVKGAKNALFITDVTMVTEAHAMGVAQYANLYEPFSAWDRLWTKRVAGEKVDKKVSIREMVNDGIWSGKNKRDVADAYFRQLFTDIQGVKTEKRDGDAFYSALRSTYVSAALGFNLSSILKQTGSFASAMVYLSPMDLAKGLGMNLKADRPDMWKYSKVANARMFERGRFVNADANTRLENAAKWVRKLGEKSMAGVEGMDNMVVGRLWNACQQNVARTKGFAIGTEENKVAAGKLLDTVINETQSSSTQDTRSAYQRGGALAQTLTMFTSDAVKQVSFLYEGAARVYSARLRRKMGQGSDAEVKAANRFLGRSIASFAASTALMVAITQFIKWLLGREREEGESIVQDIGNETLGQVLGIFPIVSDIYGKVANNYDVDSFAFEAINGVLDGAVSLGTNLHKAANGEAVSRQEILKPMRSVVIELGNFTGLPVRNFANYVVGVTKKLSPEAGYAWDALFESPSYEADIAKALEKGDEKLAQYVLELSLRNRVSDGDYNSAVAAELLSLTNNGEKVTPSSIPGSVNGVAVNAQQYKQMQKIYSGAAGALSDMMASDAYNSLSDEERGEAINTVYRTYLSLAKARVLPAEDNKRTATVWVAPLFKDGQSYSALGAIASMESTDDKSRSELVTEYLNSLDISNDERYLILFAAGYRSKGVLERVRKLIANSTELSDEEKKAFEAQFSA